MKSKHLLSFFLFAAPLFLLAQPTITRDWLGQSGDIFGNVGSTVTPDVTPSGANAFWDFSDVDQIDSTLFAEQFVQADTTPFFDQFPSANTCLFSAEDDPEAGPVQGYMYGTATDDSWQSIGFRVSSLYGVIGLDYSDPLTTMSFPFTFGSTFDDTYASTLDAIFILSFGRGTQTVTGDSYGVVELPFGTFPNCLRVRIEDSRTDSSSFFGATSLSISNTMTYLWLSPEHVGPIASYQEIAAQTISFVTGLPPDTSEVEFDTTFTYNPLLTPSSTRSLDLNAFDVTAFPNPVVDVVDVQYTLPTAQEIDIKVFTANGQLVHSSQVDGYSGTNTARLTLAHLAAGSYLAVVQGKKQASVIQIVKAQ